MSTEAEQLTLRLVEAYERGDIDGMLDCYADGADYQPGSLGHVVGKPAIRRLLEDWFRSISVTIEIHNVVSSGQIVVQERTDRTTIGDREIITPIAVVYEVDGGLITACREYFDTPRPDDP